MSLSTREDTAYENYLMETWASEVSKYDRTILSLAGGALALSVTFIRDIASLTPEWVWMVATGWLALIASMGLIVWSFPTTKRAIEARWRYDHALGDRLSERAWKRSLAAGVLLAVGVFLVAGFALLNLGV